MLSESEKAAAMARLWRAVVSPPPSWCKRAVRDPDRPYPEYGVAVRVELFSQAVGSAKAPSTAAMARGSGLGRDESDWGARHRSAFHAPRPFRAGGADYFPRCVPVEGKKPCGSGFGREAGRYPPAVPQGVLAACLRGYGARVAFGDRPGHTASGAGRPPGILPVDFLP